MHLRDAGVAHPVERHLAKVEVASSSLVTRSMQKPSFVCVTKEGFCNNIRSFICLRHIKERILFHTCEAGISCAIGVYHIAAAIYH